MNAKDITQVLPSVNLVFEILIHMFVVKHCIKWTPYRIDQELLIVKCYKTANQILSIEYGESTDVKWLQFFLKVLHNVSVGVTLQKSPWRELKTSGYCCSVKVSYG